MKRFLIALATGFLCVGGAGAFELMVDQTDSGSVLVGSNAGSPTLILTNNPNAMRTYIVNQTTNVVYLNGMITTSTSTPAAFSISLTSGSFFIASSTSTQANGTLTPIVFSPDGPADPYRGPMWAVAGGNGAVIQRIRMK